MSRHAAARFKVTAQHPVLDTSKCTMALLGSAFITPAAFAPLAPVEPLSAPSDDECNAMSANQVSSSDSCFASRTWPCRSVSLALIFVLGFCLMAPSTKSPVQAMTTWLTQETIAGNPSSWSGWGSNGGPTHCSGIDNPQGTAQCQASGTICMVCNPKGFQTVRQCGSLTTACLGCAFTTQNGVQCVAATPPSNYQQCICQLV